MDLRSLKLHFKDRHARVVVVDARGERGVDLEGEAFDSIAKTAAPLVAALESRAEKETGKTVRVRALSVDAVARVIRASLDENAASSGTPALRLDGIEYDELQNVLAGLFRATFGVVRPGRPDISGTPSEARFWDELYRVGGDGWELGRAAPPLADYVRAHSLKGRSALVVGCGRGHEARLLAEAGADVDAIDISPEAIAAASALHSDVVAEGRLRFVLRDLFELPRNPVRAAAYDLVVEHCCFCAIDPSRRGEYVRSVSSLLAPGGELLGLFWAHGRPGGPPFSTSENELRELFDERFTVEELAIAKDSAAARQGEELLARFRLR